MRRVVVVVLWLAAIASVVVAIGMRVRARRLADPVQTLRGYLNDVPSALGDITTIIARDPHSLQMEIRANQKWVRTFVERNRFVRVDGSLEGLRADRWVLTETRKKGAVVHVLLPLDGQPALLTISE